jgi:hypothetical protein
MLALEVGGKNIEYILNLITFSQKYFLVFLEWYFVPLRHCDKTPLRKLISSLLSGKKNSWLIVSRHVPMERKSGCHNFMFNN